MVITLFLYVCFLGKLIHKGLHSLAEYEMFAPECRKMKFSFFFSPCIDFLFVVPFYSVEHIHISFLHNIYEYVSLYSHTLNPSSYIFRFVCVSLICVFCVTRILLTHLCELVSHPCEPIHIFFNSHSFSLRDLLESS